MTQLRYKDYQGAVTFADGTLIIQILTSTTSSQRNAKARRKPKPPLKNWWMVIFAPALNSTNPLRSPFKGSFNVRVSPELHRAIAMQASENGETMNAWVESALKEKVERQNSYKRLFRAEAHAHARFYN